MQHGLRHGKSEHNIDSEIDRDIKNASSRCTLIASQCVECPFCSNTFLRQFIDDHLLVCANSKKNGDDRTQAEDTKFIKLHEQTTGRDAKYREHDMAVRPHPPRNLKVTHVGFDSISISWDKPIFDGGGYLMDY